MIRVFKTKEELKRMYPNMTVDFNRLLSKYHFLKRSTYSDDVMHSSTIFTAAKVIYVTISITAQGDVLIISRDDNSPRANVLVDKQYFNQDKLEKDLEIFLSPFIDKAPF